LKITQQAVSKVVRNINVAQVAQLENNLTAWANQVYE